MPQLTCLDLSLGYEGRTVVSGLSFIVNAGDYLCIVGHNGSGKTTLMRAILHLTAPAAGHIETGDGLAPYDMGYLPQQTVTQKDFPASVREVVLSGCLNRRGMRPYYNRQEKRLADAQMEKLGVTALSGECYRDLSGGQQQRVLLARALCAARKILLLDEPAAGLDPEAQSYMYTLIEELNLGGMTIVMVSHDIAASVKYASHILHLGAQTPLFFGTTADYTISEAGLAYTGVQDGDPHRKSE
ncbi:MAG: ATP-binding cassette domain-containing protein [Peptococcaceae bacterium]|nr:ATP-binding cassette domain-containing protein [Peptococcaceae bacterium]